MRDWNSMKMRFIQAEYWRSFNKRILPYLWGRTILPGGLLSSQ